jgi:choline dehydrogenase-like flavoprotein
MQLWADAVNDTSYTFDETLPYYKRSVHFTPPNVNLRASNATAKYNPDAFDKNGGPLEVSYANYAQPFSSWMNLGMQAIGIKEVDDFNQGSLMGGQYCSSTIDPANEIRSSSEESFLSKITPASLTTYTNTLAKKVIFNQNKKATGVQVRGLLGNTVTLSASKEVILSAGAFQSPQLLMVSGVGPADTLNEHGIDIVAELPGVGQNMWDHPFFAPSYRVQVSTLTEFANNLIYAAGRVMSGILMKTGPITNPVSDYLAWEKIPQSLRSTFSKATRSALSRFSNDWPEAEVRDQT